MQQDSTHRPERTAGRAWSVIASGDNGFELLECVIPVSNFAESAQLGSEIAEQINAYKQSDQVDDTQITLRAWRVEVPLTAPVGAWNSPSQQELAMRISSRLDP